MKNPINDIVKLNFNQNKIEKLHSLGEKFSEIELRQEPSFSRMLWKDALNNAGPCTKIILDIFEKYLKFDRKYILVDVQIQFLKKNQFTTNKEGTSWHLDGATSIHPVLTEYIGGKITNSERGMLDLYDSLNRKNKMRFYSFFQGEVSKTEYINDPLILEIPKCINTFEQLSDIVNEKEFKIYTQKPLDLMCFDDSVLHRATAAISDGWRYWVRIGEIDFLPRPRARHIDTVYGND